LLLTPTTTIYNDAFIADFKVYSMWSRRFLWTGLSTGAVFALLTVAAVWLALFAASGNTDHPFWTIADIVDFTLPGLIIYPACWYIIIFRSRNYSFRQTMVLVAQTFGIGCAVVAIALIGGAEIALASRAGSAAEAAIYATLSPVVYGLMTLIGAVILIIPYSILATPIALLHRWLLLRIFTSSGSPIPGTGAMVPPMVPE
jgi:hypothetical protein